MLLNGLSRYRDHGLLFLRVGLGIMFILHGWPKLAAGPDRWEILGANMSMFGLGFAPAFWGFMAGLAETLGGLCLALGFLFRPVLLLLLIPTMIVATASQLAAKERQFSRYAYPLEMGIVFTSLLLIGPGRYSLDEKLLRRRPTPSSNTP